MWLWVGRLWSAEERTAAELRTDPLAVLILRLIDTAGLVRMHYGSVVAVYCLALRGVGSRCVSQPVRHLKAEKKTHLHQPCCRTLRWWQKRLISVFMYSRGGCGVSAFQPRLCLPSKISFSPLPPSLPPRTGSRAFTEVNVLMSETDWYCSAVRRGVDAVFMCMNDCVCVHGWCSGLAELQQWLSPSEPNLAPVCWWALLTFALTGCCGLWS